MENLEVCRTCGGLCCKQSGGLVFPSDAEFIGSPGLSEFLKNNLRNDIFSVDALIDSSAGITGYYIRMRQDSDTGRFNPGIKGQCSSLRIDGCSFEYSKRPKGCRDLVPAPPKCYFDDGLSVGECVEAWKPYTDLIESLIREP